MKCALFSQAGGSFTGLLASAAVEGVGTVTGAELSALLFGNPSFAGAAGGGGVVETAGSLFASAGVGDGAGVGVGADVGAEGDAGAGGAAGGSGVAATSGGGAGGAIGLGAASLAGSDSAAVAVGAASTLGNSVGSSLMPVFSRSGAARVTACKPVVVAVAD